MLMSESTEPRTIEALYSLTEKHVADSVEARVYVRSAFETIMSELNEMRATHAALSIRVSVLEMAFVGLGILRKE